MSESVTVDHGAFTVTSNNQTADDLSASLTAADDHYHTPNADSGDETESKPKNDLSEAGRKLASGKRDKVQERIDKSVAAQRSAERERDAERQKVTSYEQRIQQLEARVSQVSQPSAAPAQTQQTIAQATPEAKADAIAELPSLDKYESIEAWQKDVAAQIRKQAMEDFRAEQRQSEYQRAESERLKAVQSRIETFKAEHSDYDSLVNNVIVPPNAPAHDVLFAHLQYSEMGPQLAYELAQNPDELHRIVSLPPGPAVAALGRLEAKIESRSTSAPTTAQTPKLVVSNAKPPIKPLGSSPSVADDAPDEIPFGPAYVQAMNARERQSRRTR